MKKLKSSPFRNSTKAGIFMETCNPDYNNGHSDIVPMNALIELGLGLGNGGSWCRKNGPLGLYFNINRRIEKGKIISVQLVGYRKNKFNNYIKKSIRDETKTLDCRLSSINGGTVEADHKDGRRDTNIPLEDQKMEDFQPLSKAANDAKRQHCKKCKATGQRFDATRLGYVVSQWMGPAEYDGSCEGCLWNDLAEFNAQISCNFKKER